MGNKIKRYDMNRETCECYENENGDFVSYSAYESANAKFESASAALEDQTKLINELQASLKSANAEVHKCNLLVSAAREGHAEILEENQKLVDENERLRNKTQDMICDFARIIQQSWHLDKKDTFIESIVAIAREAIEKHDDDDIKPSEANTQLTEQLSLANEKITAQTAQMDKQATTISELQTYKDMWQSIAGRANLQGLMDKVESLEDVFGASQKINMELRLQNSALQASEASLKSVVAELVQALREMILKSQKLSFYYRAPDTVGKYSTDELSYMIGKLYHAQCDAEEALAKNDRKDGV